MNLINNDWVKANEAREARLERIGACIGGAATILIVGLILVRFV